MLDGGADDDVLQGDESADRFVFRRNGGDDRIVDFLDGEDIVDLTVFGFRDFTQVAALVYDTAAGMVLDLTGRNGGTVIVEGFTVASFDASDVLL